MPESLSGSEIAARMERNTQELGRPRPLLFFTEGVEMRDPKGRASRWRRGSQIVSWYSEGGKAARMGKGTTE
jgi:hypothetical protein